MKFFVFVASLLAAAAPLYSAAPCCSAMEAKTPAELPAKSIYQLPLHLTDDRGADVKLSDLMGQPVVLTMFYSDCQYACPLLVEEMKKIRADLPGAVANKPRFVLISFDPDHDDTAALHAYREQRHLDSQWTLLRGSAEDIRTLAMVLGVQFKKETTGFAHSNLITILNESGEIVHQRTGFQDKLTDTTKVLVAAIR